MGVKVNLGSGPLIKSGFINIDMLDTVHKIPGAVYLKHDLSKGIPVSDIDFIYSCHFLEHMTWKEGQTLLKDCYSKMNSGARIKLVLPDFRKMVGAYVENNWSFWLPDVKVFAPNKQMMEIMNYGLYQFGEHKCMYDLEFALFSLKNVGFRECKEATLDPSYDEMNELRTRYSLYCEGIK